MCGRVDLGGEVDITKFLKMFQVTKNNSQGSQVGQRDVPPSLTMPVIIGLPGGGRALEDFRWGMPQFEGFKGDLINAKVESLHKFDRYRDALKHRRCVVPVGAFYEWRKEAGKPKKVKYRFKLKDEDVMCLAGIWEEGQPGHSDIPTFAIITCPPNELVAQYHDRMPAILLDNDAVDLWLDPDFYNFQALKALLKPYPAAQMEVEEVPPEEKSVRVVTGKASVFDEQSRSANTLEPAGANVEDHEDILRNLQAHMRCMFFEERDGVVFYCGVVDPNRPAARVGNQWRCSKHGGHADQLSLNDLFDT
jgi:putative SOS response-associated peptidase YedK